MKSLAKPLAFTLGIALWLALQTATFVYAPGFGKGDAAVSREKSATHHLEARQVSCPATTSQRAWTLV